MGVEALRPAVEVPPRLSAVPESRLCSDWMSSSGSGLRRLGVASGPSTVPDELHLASNRLQPWDRGYAACKSAVDVVQAEDARQRSQNVTP
jgi:hypothetical protein